MFTFVIWFIGIAIIILLLRGLLNFWIDFTNNKRMEKENNEREKQLKELDLFITLQPIESIKNIVKGVKKDDQKNTQK